MSMSAGAMLHLLETVVPVMGLQIYLCRSTKCLGIMRPSSASLLDHIAAVPNRSDRTKLRAGRMQSAEKAVHEQ